MASSMNVIVGVLILCRLWSDHVVGFLDIGVISHHRSYCIHHRSYCIGHPDGVFARMSSIPIQWSSSTILFSRSTNQQQHPEISFGTVGC